MSPSAKDRSTLYWTTEPAVIRPAAAPFDRLFRSKSRVRRRSPLRPAVIRDQDQGKSGPFERRVIPGEIPPPLPAPDTPIPRSLDRLTDDVSSANSLTFDVLARRVKRSRAAEVIERGKVLRVFAGRNTDKIQRDGKMIARYSPVQLFVLNCFLSIAASSL